MDLNLSNKMYDFLNALVRMILPGFGTLYFALAEIWGLPYATEVVGTIVALTTFLGLVIMLARRGWKVDDELVIDENDPDGIAFGFKDNPHLIEELEEGQTVVLKVNKKDGRRFLEDEDPDAGARGTF